MRLKAIGMEAVKRIKRDKIKVKIKRVNEEYTVMTGAALPAMAAFMYLATSGRACSGGGAYCVLKYIRLR